MGSQSARDRRGLQTAQTLHIGETESRMPKTAEGREGALCHLRGRLPLPDPGGGGRPRPLGAGSPVCRVGPFAVLPSRGWGKGSVTCAKHVQPCLACRVCVGPRSLTLLVEPKPPASLSCFLGHVTSPHSKRLPVGGDICLSRERSLPVEVAGCLVHQRNFRLLVQRCCGSREVPRRCWRLRPRGGQPQLGWVTSGRPLASLCLGGLWRAGLALG